MKTVKILHTADVHIGAQESFLGTFADKRRYETLITFEKIFDLAEIFKVFGDSTRIKIINALMMRELCVCDIAAITNSTPSAISHQLRVLKQAKLVKYRKEGKAVFYSLDDEHVKEIFEKGREHIEEV